MKNENGFTGVDIAISVIVLTIFVTIIGTMIFNFNSNSNEMEYRSKALNYAINKIERLKSLDISDPEIANTPDTEILENGKATGYYEKIDVVDATDIMSDSDLNGRERVEGLVKKVTVTTSYNFRNQTKSIELSTIISKNF